MTQPGDSEREKGSRLVGISDTRLYVVERGTGLPVIVLHGGPGDDHHEFADYLDPLADRFRLILVDQRSQGRSEGSDPATWTLARMAADVAELAAALGLTRYAVLGHSFGAMVALQQAVDSPGAAVRTIISSGIPSLRFLEGLEANLASFEPIELREQVRASWDREAGVQTQDDFASLMHDQLPFHFADPRDLRISDYERRSARTRYAPAVLRAFAADGYGRIDLENRLGRVSQPVLVLAGRHDRTCSVEAAEAMAAGIPDARLVIFERSGHMTFVEETAGYLAAVEEFLADVDPG